MDMLIQTALDRVSMEDALKTGKILEETTDILEIGTSLIKDYGLMGSVGVFRQQFPQMKILGDIKTCDEGAYEFRKAFEAGADIVTVMGFSSDATIQACMKVAAEMKRACMIDLLEVSADRTGRLAEMFPEAVFAIHLPSDLKGQGLARLVERMCEKLGGNRHVAAAGGIQLEDIPFLRDSGVEIAIIGGAITKAEKIRETASAFRMAARQIRKPVKRKR